MLRLAASTSVAKCPRVYRGADQSTVVQVGAAQVDVDHWAGDRTGDHRPHVIADERHELGDERAARDIPDSVDTIDPEMVGQ